MVRPHSDKPRSKRFWLRLTAKENLAAREAAAKAGLSLSDWMRREILKKPRRPSKLRDAPTPESENAAELQAAGKKVNAIAHALNAGHQVSPDEIGKVCDELRRAIQPHLEKLKAAKSGGGAKKKGRSKRNPGG